MNMPILKTVSEKKAKGKVKKVFDTIKKTRKINTVPNFWKTIAADPDTLERTWNSLQQVMKKGSLDPLTKELIYVAVSMTNSCEYCIRSHSLAAKKKGMTDKMLKELIAIVGMANETNRLVESYQVEVDKLLKHMKYQDTRSEGIFEVLISIHKYIPEYTKYKESDLVTGNEKIIIATIHKAKGLEFENVIIPWAWLWISIGYLHGYR